MVGAISAAVESTPFRVKIKGVFFYAAHTLPFFFAAGTMNAMTLTVTAVLLVVAASTLVCEGIPTIPQCEVETMILPSQVLGGPTAGTQVVGGNFNDDLFGDVAYVDPNTPSGQSVVLRFSTGNSLGSPQYPAPSYSQAYSIAAADLNGDGRKDLAVAGGLAISGWLIWLQNNGGGSFTQRQLYSGSNPATGRMVQTGLVNGDALVDLVALFTSDTQKGLYWFRNNGGSTPSFTRYTIRILSTFHEGMAVADFTGDGRDDLALAGLTGQSGTLLQLFTNPGGSSTSTWAPSTINAQDGQAIFARKLIGHDMDYDGNLDVLVADQVRGSIYYYPRIPGEPQAFGPARTITTAVEDVYDMFVADVDGDGLWDVGSASPGDQKVAVYFGANTQGVFGGQKVVASSAQPRSVTLSDINGDGTPDFIALDSTSLSWFSSHTLIPPRSFSKVIENFGAAHISLMRVVDIDGDGFDDLVSSRRRVYVGLFDPHDQSFDVTNVDSARATAVTLGSFTNREGWLDIVYVKDDGRLDLECLDGSTWRESRITASVFPSAPVIPLLIGGDWDGDGDDDILFSTDGAVLELLVNDGSPNSCPGRGGFVGVLIQDLNVSIPEGTFPSAYHSADVNGDTFPDLLLGQDGGSGVGDDHVYVLLGGPFLLDGFVDSLTLVLPSASSLATLVTFDYNRDDTLDLFWNGGYALGSESGGFGPLVATPYSNPYDGGLAFGDMEGTGWSDLVGGDKSQGVFRHAGTSYDPSGIESGRKTLATDDPADVAVRDFNKDGVDDVVYAQDSGADIYLSMPERNRLGAVNPSFSDFPLVVAANTVSAEAMSVRDVDGDGELDLVVADRMSGTVVWYGNGGGGSGTLGSGRTIANALSSPRTMEVKDVDGDGDLDVVVLSKDEGSVSVFLNHDGRGNFGPRGQAPGQAIEAMAVGSLVTDDLERTPRGLDLVVVEYPSGSPYNDGTILIYPNAHHQTSSGRSVVSPEDVFESSAPVVVATGRTVSSAHLGLGDFDGDGDVDIVCSENNNLVGWRASGGGRTWTVDGSSTSTTNQISQLAVGHVNSDGKADVVVISIIAQEVAWFRKDGSNNWVESVISGVTATPISLALGDTDADGVLDIVVGFLESNLAVFTNNKASPGSSFGSLVIDSSVSSVFGVAAGDIDGDGDVDVVAASGSDETVRVYRSLTRTAFFIYSPRVFTVDSLGSGLIPGTEGPCVTDPFSFACLGTYVSQTSRCVRDTILLPAGNYSCRLDSHFRITWPVSFEAEVLGTGVAFECGGGVLFDGVAHTGVGSGVVAEWSLTGIDVVGTGVARNSMSDGSPGLRVSCPGCSLTVQSGAVRSGVSTADALEPTSVSAVRPPSPLGQGGCVHVSAGGSLVLGTGATISHCTAASGGGGVYVAGTGSVLEMHPGSSVASCRVESPLGSGGGVNVLDDGALVCEGGEIMGNYAGGSGGGVAVWSSAARDSSVMRGCLVDGNSAGVLGGGLAIGLTAPLINLGGGVEVSSVSIPVAEVASSEGALGCGVLVALVDSKVAELNEGGFGSGMFVCNGRVAVNGSETVVSGGVFVCAERGVSPGEANAERWVDIDVTAESGVSASFSGPLAYLEWVEPPQVSVEAGESMTGSFRAVDWLGSSSSFGSESSALARLIVEGAAGEEEQVSVSSPPTFVMSDLSLVRLPVAPLGAASFGARLPAKVDYTVSVAVGDEGLGYPPMGLSGQVRVDPCGPDKGGVSTVSGSVTTISCSVCGAGTFADPQSDGTLEACTIIPSCLPGSVDVENDPNVQLPECVCDNGFFFVGLSDASNGSLPVPQCNPCPEGGVCLRGLNPPGAAPGFFPSVNSSYGPIEFVRCKRANACPGATQAGGNGESNVCAAGYTGYMCNTCGSEYYTDGNGDCVACPDRAVSLFSAMFILLVLGCVVAAGVVAYTLVKVRKGGGENDDDDDDDDDADSLRGRSTPASFSLIVVAFQVVGLVGNADFGWSSSSRSTMGVFGAANVDTSLFASECSLGSFHTKYAISILLPAFILALVLATLFLIRGMGRIASLKALSVGSVVDAVVFAVAPLLYIPMAKATFVIFDCSRLPNGDFVLDADPGVTCFDSAWWGVVWMGGVALGVYVIGLPAYFLVRILKSRHTLMERETFARYGALYKLYRVPYYWGGVADLGKRLGIVVATVFSSEHVVLQLALLFGILGGSAFLIATRQPYYYPLYNQVDLALNCVLLSLLVLGFASYSERNVSSSGTQSTLEVFTLGVIAVLVLVAVVGIGMDVLQIYRARSGVYATPVHRMRLFVKAVQSEIPDMYPEDAAVAEEMLVRLAPKPGSRRGDVVCLVEPWDGGDDSVGWMEEGGGEEEAGLELKELTPPLAE